jgi:hypothetical protein
LIKAMFGHDFADGLPRESTQLGQNVTLLPA